MDDLDPLIDALKQDAQRSAWTEAGSVELEPRRTYHFDVKECVVTFPNGAVVRVARGQSGSNDVYDIYRGLLFEGGRLDHYHGDHDVAQSDRLWFNGREIYASQSSIAGESLEQYAAPDAVEWANELLGRLGLPPGNEVFTRFTSEVLQLNGYTLAELFSG